MNLLTFKWDGWSHPNIASYTLQLEHSLSSQSLCKIGTFVQIVWYVLDKVGFRRQMSGFYGSNLQNHILESELPIIWCLLYKNVCLGPMSGHSKDNEQIKYMQGKCE